MVRPVVTGIAVLSPVMLIGQAPGVKEGPLGRPFAWTAGKTLFQWFATIGVAEADFRERVYMAAVCRCFPGKAPKGGGDRVPAPPEIARCSKYLETEARLLKPRLVIPVGKLAISELGLFGTDKDAKLVDVVGRTVRATLGGVEVDAIALPHPSGASTWHRMEPGKQLLARALTLIEGHPAWRSIRGDDRAMLTA